MTHNITFLKRKQNYRISKRKIISRTIKAVDGRDSGKGGRKRWKERTHGILRWCNSSAWYYNYGLITILISENQLNFITWGMTQYMNLKKKCLEGYKIPGKNAH